MNLISPKTLGKIVILASALMLGLGLAQAANLKWAAQNDILTLDPHSQNHATTNNIVGHAYEGLVRYDRNYRIEACLATSWQTVNPTTWRFNLRKDVKFHDGSSFTADDVIFSFDRIRQPQGTMQIYVAGVKEIKKVDDHTIDMILDKPNPVLLNSLVTFLIMDKEWAAKNKSEKVQDYKAKEDTFASRNTNGTGPYVIKEWAPDQRIVMSANKSWWGKAEGNVTDIVYTPIKADATRIAALLAGDVDLVTDLPTQDVARLRTTASLSVLDGPEAVSYTHLRAHET
ncbi:MAG: ABC transporter substrate-binding protein, partial [Betaproteobacteria bacterium]|nr:ABC transporter substrate-binding protein [Betaproteobacteria bacterium]